MVLRITAGYSLIELLIAVNMLAFSSVSLLHFYATYVETTKQHKEQLAEKRLLTKQTMAFIKTSAHTITQLASHKIDDTSSLETMIVMQFMDTDGDGRDETWIEVEEANYANVSTRVLFSSDSADDEHTKQSKRRAENYSVILRYSQ